MWPRCRDVIGVAQIQTDGHGFGDRLVCHCIYYALHGEAKTAAVAFESNLLAYVELLLFILVSMTYLNAMEERGVFDGLRIWLLSRQYSYRKLFWITGVLAFCFSTVISGLAVA